MSEEYDRFLDIVGLKAGLPRDDAERAARATLQTLAERLSAGQARDLADRLPPELAPYAASTTPADAFDVDEFIRRVAEREGIDDLGSAERHAQAVFAALGRTVGEDEVADMVSELPKGFLPLVAEAQHRFSHVLSADEFLRRVGDRAGLDPRGARRATDAVLETLAERISGGEVADLISRLPVELHPPLKTGDAKSNGAARPMSLDEFVRRIAEREAVTPAEAREHARAVFATLREAVGEKEFLDVSAQLPLEFAAVAARPW